MEAFLNVLKMYVGMSVGLESEMEKNIRKEGDTDLVF